MDKELETEEGENAEEEEVPLCLGCLEVVQEDQLLCGNCGCPQDYVSSSIPYIRILAQGYVLRQAVERPVSWTSIVLVGLIFSEYFCLGIGWLGFAWMMRHQVGVLLPIFLVPGTVLCLLVCWPVYRSFTNYRNRDRNPFLEEEDTGG